MKEKAIIFVVAIVFLVQGCKEQRIEQNGKNTVANEKIVTREADQSQPILKKGREKEMEKTRTGNKKEYQKPDDETLRKNLTPLQYKVTRREGTEPPFNNEYWDNKREGIYVDIVSGEPLFSSLDKYDSETGWPSFTRPLDPDNIVEKEDRHLFMKRTEVKSRYGDSHLGHVFDDGPSPTGLRYCMNSAALRFIPKEDLEKEGYGDYLKLFERSQHKER